MASSLTSGRSTKIDGRERDGIAHVAQVVTQILWLMNSNHMLKVTRIEENSWRLTYQPIHSVLRSHPTTELPYDLLLVSLCRWYMAYGRSPDATLLYYD